MTLTERIRALQEEYARQRVLNEEALDERVRSAEALDPEIARLRGQNIALPADALRRMLATNNEDEKRRIAEQMRDTGIANNAKIRARLKKLGLPENNLELSYRCPICQDTGYVGEAPARFCECFEAKLRQMQFEESGLNKNPEQRFERFDITRFPEENRQRAEMRGYRRHCETYANEYPNNAVRNMLITGAGGLGKTFLLNCIYARVTERGYSAIRVTAFQMFEAMRARHFQTEDAVDQFAALVSAPLLLIDDLGTEPMMRNITAEYLFLLLNERLSARLHTVVASNLGPTQLSERYGERVSSRLVDQAIIMHMQGKDLRAL